ncbi:MAG TPA: MinD/ParA family protein [Gammaproteobacteria bacterium]|nr:MinD/ParA family protein [Gammaproteobacteria bacterium]
MFEGALDQAAGLRSMTESRPVQVIAITSGKGGVGKTNVSVNLALSMISIGKKVLLMDADLGLANIDVLLGIRPTHNLSHVMSGECSLEDVIVEGPMGLQIIPASSGIQQMAEMNPMEHAGIIRSFSELSMKVDVLLIDTAAGISDSVVSFSRAAHEVVVVVCDEPASMTDAYAMIKLLNTKHGLQRFRVLSSMVPNVEEGRKLYSKLVKVTNDYLEVTLDFMGVVPYDESLRKAVRKQRAVVEAYPRSKATLAFKSLAKKADKWAMPTVARGHLEFFVERLIQAGKSKEGRGE